MNTPGLRDPVVMRVLSDFYWTAATGGESLFPEAWGIIGWWAES